MLKMSGKTTVKLSHDIDSEEIQTKFDIQMKEALCVCVFRTRVKTGVVFHEYTQLGAYGMLLLSEKTNFENK